ncbi:DUF948 domain-containing protein [Natribacillus halophilus]|uniref:Uncharacterized protein YoxC, contains an MCP-like domain n=1 Tax=Natribacillus halophilus TaxID=549003 RepID=A0A1G8LJE5_9BACI|nr:DUF948 domain-containing protein [Natribacillus halophilus]SDI55745.1 Uncharacterized protein YoxC, contains an MCP-like domain [Natribacillus halophilus]
MDLLGIAAIIAALAFAVLVIYLARALGNLTNVLAKTEVTVEKLPEQLDGITKETGTVLHNTNETLLDVNEKIATLNPLFEMVGDAGEASRKLSSSLVDMTASFKKESHEANDTSQQKGLSGFYGLAAFIYLLRQKRKEKGD